MNQLDVVIVGAGAAGLMCAIEAGKRGKQVLVLDHANKVGKKILMSGGGRCNFTNLHIEPSSYQSHNPHFVKSALKRYTQWDFIKLVEQHQIPYYEKTLGQLFCKRKSIDIVNLLLAESREAQVKITLNTKIHQIQTQENNPYRFKLETTTGSVFCNALVIASGGLSIPTMGASPFAYHVAEQFGIKVWPTRAGLVPFTLNPEQKKPLESLIGTSVACMAESQTAAFSEGILFTHRGLSGPAMLQISSYWDTKECIQINLLPDIDLPLYLKNMRACHPKKRVHSILHQNIPKSLIEAFIPEHIRTKTLADCSNADFAQTAQLLQSWHLRPNGTEGYRTAEVTLGGVDCDAISSKTMETHNVPGLFFIGEALDVTGWLGGYNFQWAWSSGFAAGQAV